MIIKAGYKTSEFWFTLVSFIFSGLYLTGVLTENNQKEELIQIVSHAVESVILIGGQIFILARYIKGRTVVKEHIIDSEKTEKTNNESRTNTKPKKPNKRTTRKPNSSSKTVSRKSKKSSN